MDQEYTTAPGVNPFDDEYHLLIRHILKNGVRKTDRTGTGTISVFGYQMRFDLSDGFPLLTTKKVALKAIIHELLWFLRGDTNIKYLVDNDVNIWNEWADESGNLGPIYGHQWRSWPTADGRQIDQISEAIRTLQQDPDSRRIIVSAWNVGELERMRLPPCHAFFQFYVAPLSINERFLLLENLDDRKQALKQSDQETALDKLGVRRNRLSCQLYQRSCDTFLGVPFNIASYSLLTLMVAQVCNMVPGEFIWTGGDTHIYLNHLEQVGLQLSRVPRTPPRMRLNSSVRDIFAFHFEDFILEDYNPHPGIRAPIAV